MAIASEGAQYGITGWPLTHSFSPDYFSEKFRREGINATYSAFPLQTVDELPGLIAAHPQLHGLNVTIPYKTAVLPFMDRLSADAAAIGAVNCIRIGAAGLEGHNTDWQGFRDSLKPLLKRPHRKALVFGSGGAAKAVVYALKQLGITFRVVSRGDRQFLSYGQVTPALLAETFLLINTTPLGMALDRDRSPEIPYESLTPDHLLYDLIYNPDETKFLRLGKEKGATVKNGLEMLHLQAEASWKIWNG